MAVEDQMKPKNLIFGSWTWSHRTSDTGTSGVEQAAGRRSCALKFGEVEVAARGEAEEEQVVNIYPI